VTNIPIQVNKVGKRFGQVQALDDVSLAVGQGEMLGLIGHNGAGKSTLFKLMLGLLPPSGGEIRIHGKPIAGRDFRRMRRCIGYLPENFVAYDNLTGLEVLQLFADFKQVPRRECQPMLERAGLGAAGARRVRGYSKGMRQRLGFAQVLLGNPDLIFLDEPTNGLDAEAIHDFYRILREVQAQGATIVITSHILAEIQERVDSLVILNNGRVAAQGTLAQLRARTGLPSVIAASLHPGYRQEVQGMLARLDGISVTIGDDTIRIGVPSEQKMAVLQLLSMHAHVVRDVAIHEPSLEDVFLGYGGAHG
jgi:Cu-processing system ATP-binding protein